MSVVFYFTALCLPGFCSGFGYCENLGIELVIFGGFTIFDHPIGIIWLANPILWYAWYYISNSKKAVRASITSTSIALLFLLFDSVPNYGWCGSFLEPVPCNNFTIESIELGYVLWLLSSVTVLISSLINHYKID